MTNLITEYTTRGVTQFKVGVSITKDNEDVVNETKLINSAETAREALQTAQSEYKDDDWEVVRLRYITTVFDDG